MPRLITICCVLALFFATPAVKAQVLASERSTITQNISGTQVVIDYSRPSMRGRTQIWGEMEPWDIAWTPGANTATSFSFSKDVTINDVAVEAGKYSVWFELRENEPWRMMLNHDTTLFHIPYPPMDHEQMYKIIEIEHQQVDSWLETLRFDIQNIRPDGGVIEFQWADTYVPLQLGIDPGYHMSFTAEEAAPFEGTWTLDASMGRPPQTSIDAWTADMSEEELEDFQDYLRFFDEPYDIVLEYDSETGYLSGISEFMSYWIGASMDVPNMLLIQKSEGIFVEAGLMNGTVMHVDESKFWEFEMDDSGRATVLVQRGAQNDNIVGRAERTNVAN
jgi:hypothetical protein